MEQTERGTLESSVAAFITPIALNMAQKQLYQGGAVQLARNHTWAGEILFRALPLSRFSLAQGNCVGLSDPPLLLHLAPLLLSTAAAGPSRAGTTIHQAEQPSPTAPRARRSCAPRHGLSDDTHARRRHTRQPPIQVRLPIRYTRKSDHHPPRFGCVCP